MSGERGREEAWEASGRASLAARTRLGERKPWLCRPRCTAGAEVRAGTPHLSVTSVNRMSRTCVLWNRSSWEPASPSAGSCATGVQRARKAEGEAGQHRAVKRPRTAMARFPPCCSRKALEVRISLTNVTSAGRQTGRSGSGAPSLRSRQGQPWLSEHGRMRCQPRPPLPLPGCSWARRSFFHTSSCARPSRMSKTVSPWASSST